MQRAGDGAIEAAFLRCRGSSPQAPGYARHHCAATGGSDPDSKRANCPECAANDSAETKGPPALGRGGGRGRETAWAAAGGDADCDPATVASHRGQSSVASRNLHCRRKQSECLEYPWALRSASRCNGRPGDKRSLLTCSPGGRDVWPARFIRASARSVSFLHAFASTDIDHLDDRDFTCLARSAGANGSCNGKPRTASIDGKRLSAGVRVLRAQRARRVPRPDPVRAVR